MHAMALAASPNPLLGCSHPPSLILHSSQRQVWQKNGGVLVSASAAGSEHSSRVLGPDGANEASVSTSTSRRQLVTFPVASLCACLTTTLADKASWRTQTKARRAKPYYVAASSNEGDETKEANEAPSSVTEVTEPAVSEKRAQAEAEVKKGQRTAIVTGVISVLLGVGYLVLIQLLDTRGIILVPPPPEAFDP